MAVLSRLGEAEKRTALDWVVGRPVFERSPALRKLLTYLVAREIDGDMGALREAAIGQALYGRLADYDTREDAVVRVNATRLRLRLEEIYQTEPRARVRIVLPKGGYVPLFEELEAPALESAADQTLAAAGTPQDHVVAGSMVSDMPVRQSRARGSLLWVLAVLVLMLAAAGTWSWRSGRFERPLLGGETRLVPLTAGNGFEMDPAFSPDGRLLAYAARREGDRWYSIYIKTVGSADDGRRLPNTDGSMYHPVFSPDGGQLAYVAERGTKAEIQTMDLRSGTRHTVAALPYFSLYCNNPMDEQLQVGPVWTGRQLIFAQQDTETGTTYLERVDPAQGTREPLTKPEADAADGQPAVSPDGRTLAFLRKDSAGLRGLELLDLTAGPGSSGKLRTLVSQWGPTSGLTWDRNGRELVVSSNRYRRGWSLWRIPLEGEPVIVPTRLAGRPDEPVISPRNDMMAVTSFDGTQNLAEVTVGKDGKQKTQVLFPSRQVNLTASLSPDGGRIAFLSTRSGEGELWLAARTSGPGQNPEAEQKPIQLTHGLGINMTNSIAWSPDERTLALSVRGHSYQIDLVDVATGRFHRLNAPGLDEATLFAPSWSADGKWIDVAVQDSTADGVYRIAASGSGEVRRLASVIASKAVVTDGGWIYFAPAVGAGLARVRVADNSAAGESARAEAVRGLEEVKPGYDWTVEAGGLFYLDSMAAVTSLERCDLRTGQITTVSGPLARPAFLSGISYQPDTKTLLYARYREGAGTQVMGIVGR